MKIIYQAVAVVALWLPRTTVMAGEAGNPPLPRVETVLERLVEQSQKEAANELVFRQRYGFTRLKTNEIRNNRGELKKREVKTQVNKPAPKPGKPDDAPETPSVRSKPGRKTDFTVEREFLQRFQFTLVGRETIDGRSALILDLGPAAQKPPERDLKDRVINKMAGRIWVDEAESILVQADCHLTERVNVVAGLVGAITQFTFTFNRARTGEGLWYTRHLDWHLDGREVFVYRTVDVHEEITTVQLIR